MEQNNQAAPAPIDEEKAKKKAIRSLKALIKYLGILETREEAMRAKAKAQ